MKPKYRKRLAELLHNLLENSENEVIYLPSGIKLNFDMCAYCEDEGQHTVKPSEVHSCGTSCCVVGYAPIVFPGAAKLEAWYEVSDFIVGFNAHSFDSSDSSGEDPRWTFLFSEKWENDTKHAACRALWFLEFGEVVDLDDYPDDDEDPRFDAYMAMTKDQILGLLQCWMDGKKPKAFA